MPPPAPPHLQPEPAGLELVPWEEPGWFPVPGLLTGVLCTVSLCPHLAAPLPQVHINVSLLGLFCKPASCLLLPPLLFPCLLFPKSTYYPLTCLYIFLFIPVFPRVWEQGLSVLCCVPGTEKELNKYLSIE